MRKVILVYWPKIRFGGLEKSFIRYINFLSRFYFIKIICDKESRNYSNNLFNKNLKFFYVNNSRILRVSESLYLLLVEKSDMIFAIQKDSLKICLLTKLINKKIIYFERTNPFYYKNKYLKYLNKYIYMLFLKLSDKVFVNNDLLYRYIRLTYKPRYLYRIFNPTFKKINQKNLNNNNKDTRILLAGRNDFQKNFQFIFDNIYILDKYFNNFTIDFYTNNNSYNLIQFKNKVNNLKFDSDLENKIHLYDILIFPSLYEGFPNLMLEAMNSGIRIIFSNFRFGSNEFKSNNCYKFKIDDLNSFELAIKKCSKDHSNKKKIQKDFKFLNNFLEKNSCEDLYEKIKS